MAKTSIRLVVTTGYCQLVENLKVSHLNVSNLNVLTWRFLKFESNLVTLLIKT